MSDMQQSEQQQSKEDAIQDSSFIQYEEVTYGDLEESTDMPVFEFSSPISSISSNCSSPERTVQPHQEHYQSDICMDDSGEYMSVEELVSQISPPSDDEFCSSATLVRRNTLETIYEDVYLETPPGTPSGQSESSKKRKRRLVCMNLSKCDEFKENVQTNS